RWYLPLAEQLAAAVRNKNLRVVGLVGSQDSGKSTLAALLSRLISRLHGLKVAALSLDDFYHTRKRRSQLGEEIHPLLRTRGVPGTHDIDLAVQTVNALLATHGDLAVPRFDKARDDRRPAEEWDVIAAPVDLV